MGELEGGIKGDSFCNVGTSAVEDEVREMGSCIETRSELLVSCEYKNTSDVHLTSFCRFSIEPGLGNPR